MYLLFCCQMVMFCLKISRLSLKDLSLSMLKIVYRCIFLVLWKVMGKFLLVENSFYYFFFIIQVRQFMIGIRNYFVKYGEGELEDFIEYERFRLRQDEILNIDNIIERSFYICVLYLFKFYIYNLFVIEYIRLELLVLYCNGRKLYNI